MSIKEIRSKKGFTQQDVERESGIKQSYYSRIERGRGNPTIGQFTKLSELYDVEVEELVRAYLDARPTNEGACFRSTLSDLLEYLHVTKPTPTVETMPQPA